MNEENSRDQERKGKKKKKPNLNFSVLSSLECLKCHTGNWLSFSSQPTIFSQHILKLGRKMSILYKIHTLIICHDHTLLSMNKQTTVNKKQGNLCWLLRTHSFERLPGGNGYIYHLFFAEAGQAAACPSLQSWQSTLVHNQSS